MLQLLARQAWQYSPQALVLHEGCQALIDCSQQGSALCSRMSEQMTVLHVDGWTCGMQAGQCGPPGWAV